MKKKNNLPLNYKERSNSRISFICSIVVLLLLVFIFRQLDYNMIRKPAQEAAKAMEQQKKQEEEAAKASVVTTASVIAVGDNLYHQSLYTSGITESGEWNYDHIYENVLDEIQAADIAIIDQETVFTSNHDAVSTYPSFATPTEVGDAVIKAGFNVIGSATNHIDDYGYDYMAQTFDFWGTNYPDVPLLGIHETEEDANTIQTMTVNDITIAFLDYTYGTNNPGADGVEDYMIDKFDKDKIAADIEKAKEISDCIIFIAHWGKEEEPMPNEYQKQWANYLMKQGVDVIIGGHPHVLQPYGRLSDDEGNEMVVFYSLGNFVSSQESLTKVLGGMAQFTIEKTAADGETTIRILSPEVKPTVMHYNHDEGIYGPYMLEDYSDELAYTHSLPDITGEEFSVAKLYEKFDEIMSMNVEPSTDTELLNVTIDWEGNMTDNTTGEYVEDTKSITSKEYYAQLESEDSGDSEEDYE